ncbi:LURP-one-related/scramblase family protein [Streptomyces sp. NPDC002640]
MRLVVRERMVAVGDDYWIEDEHGNKVYLVDGKAMRLRATFELKHGRTGQVLYRIHRKMVALRGTMVIEREGETLATVRKKSLSLLRNHYKVTLTDGTEMDVSGRIADREFVVEHRGEMLAVISRRWLTLRDTYGIDVVREDADPALLSAVAICVIQLAEKERADG